MSMMKTLVKSFEAQYEAHTKDKNLLLFPNLFLEPDQGTQIRNESTNEIYEITDTIKNPITGVWEGLVRISSITPPSVLKEERLEILSNNRLVRFSQEFTSPIGVEAQTADELQKDVGPIRPTIVHALIKKEPGSVGKDLFGPQKQVKPMHKEVVNNPKFVGRAVMVNIMRYDYLVEFNCFTTDPRSSELLVDWFERFVRQNTWVLKLNGVNEILFFQRLRDGAVTKWRQDLISRTVQYALRIEEILPVVTRNIRKIDRVINTDKDAYIKTTKRRIAGREIVGPISADDYYNLFHDSDGNYLFGTISVNDEN